MKAGAKEKEGKKKKGFADDGVWDLSMIMGAKITNCFHILLAIHL